MIRMFCFPEDVSSQQQTKYLSNSEVRKRFLNNEENIFKLPQTVIKSDAIKYWFRYYDTKY